MQYLEIPDSGERRAFETGSVRDTDDRKPRYSLIPILVMERVAQHFSNGARKYAVRNWQKGQPVSVYYDSLQRHLVAVIKGLDDEDHLAALIWNAIALAWTIIQIENGNLPTSLDDRHEML